MKRSELMETGGPELRMYIKYNDKFFFIGYFDRNFNKTEEELFSFIKGLDGEPIPTIRYMDKEPSFNIKDCLIKEVNLSNDLQSRLEDILDNIEPYIYKVHNEKFPVEVICNGKKHYRTLYTVNEEETRKDREQYDRIHRQDSELVSRLSKKNNSSFSLPYSPPIRFDFSGVEDLGSCDGSCKDWEDLSSRNRIIDKLEAFIPNYSKWNSKRIELIKLRDKMLTESSIA